MEADTSHAINHDDRPFPLGHRRGRIDDTIGIVAGGQTRTAGAIESQLITGLIVVFMRIEYQVDMLAHQQVEDVVLRALRTAQTKAILKQTDNDPVDPSRSCTGDSGSHPIVPGSALSHPFTQARPRSSLGGRF